ncbi:MAG: hypothetical protein E7384_04795 [Ruminococcaceae bacterium]|nr:hypothetical protein [Oscillospiraceae bacterium]
MAKEKNNCLAWAKAPRHRKRGVYSPLFLLKGGNKIKELSIFIDMSGDFGEIFNQSPFYTVTLIFHNQEHDISENVTRLKHWLKESNIDYKYIRTRLSAKSIRTII